MDYSSLPSARQRLVRTIQDLQFGRIEHLLIRNENPVWEPGPRVIRERRLDRMQEPLTVPRGPDFALKKQFVELFALFDRESALEIERLEVQHGLPFRVNIVEKVGIESMP